MPRTQDLSKMEEARKTLQSIADHRRTRPTNKSEELYYDLLAKYFGRVLRAKEEGKLLASTSDVFPAELLYAMDIVPFHLSMVTCATATMLKNQEEFLSAAKAFGLPPEVCSVHRIAAATFLKGWAPLPDIVIWNNETCDNNAKSAELIRALSQARGFYFDYPYYFGQASERYLAGEFDELIGELEKLTGKKLDLDRLRESLGLSQRLVELIEEINEIRKAVPSPAPNRLGTMMYLIRWYYQGTQEAVDYYTEVRNELKERVDKGVGFAPQEKYRLLSIFLPPNHNWKLLDWMEREHGASLVMEYFSSHWGKIDWDPSQPVMTLARRSLAEPICRVYAPISYYVDGLVEDAQAYKCHGAVYWAHTGCRHACAAIRTVKDGLTQRAGVPTLALDIDTNDPSFVSEEEMKEKLEGFFEVLAARAG